MTNRILSLKTGILASETNAAFWTAYRSGETTWVDDEHGHIAAIVHPDKVTDNVPCLLTLNQAGLLGDLIRGVERGLKLRYYQFGTRDADHPLVVSLRAFTHDGGGFISDKEDVRDSYVWTSGFSERWFKVSDLITALDNLQGRHGLENPMAVIDEE